MKQKPGVGFCLKRQEREFEMPNLRVTGVPIAVSLQSEVLLDPRSSPIEILKQTNDLISA